LGLSTHYEIEGIYKQIYVDNNVPLDFPWPGNVDDFKERAQQYGWPEVGHLAELESLAWHTKQGEGLREDLPSLPVYRYVINSVVEQLQPAKTQLPNDFLQFTHYARVVQESLNWNSSPGFPYYYNYANNGQFFGVKEGVVDQHRLLEVWPLVEERIKNKTCDPIRLFVKQEAHKLSKIRDRRWRLISSVSVIDQIIDQMLFSVQNQAMVDSWFQTPLKVGWTPFVGGWRLVPKANVVALDKTSWDWTVKLWMCEMDLEIRSRLIADGPFKKSWLDLAIFRYSSLFRRPQLVTSGGLVLRSKYDGVMKSGCVNTITSNSLMQLILHYRVSREMGVEPGRIWALGDDTLQEKQENMGEYVDRLNQYCIVKQILEKPEFAGFDFSNGVEPLYKGKHAYNLLHMDECFYDDISRSYQLMYWKSCEKARFNQLFGDVSIDFTSIWDG